MAVPPNSSDSIDTGIGGFEIPPEIDPSGRGGIYTYDVGDPDREPDPNYPERNTQLHGGNVSVDHSKKDLSKTTKLTLGHYLGKKTAPNYYRVDIPADETQQKETKITRNVDGTTPQLKDSDNSVGFAWREDVAGTVDRWTNPIGPVGWSGGRNRNEPFFQPGVERIPLSKGFDKPLDGTNYTGHDLLATVQQDPTPVLRYSLSSLTNNRFTPVNNFFVMNQEDPEKPGDKFDRVNEFNVSYTHPRYGPVTTNQMTQIGGIVTRNAAPVEESIFNASTTNSSVDIEINNREMIDKALVDISRIISDLPPDSETFPTYSSIDGRELHNVMNHPDWQFTEGGIRDEQTWITILNAGAIASIAAAAVGLDFIKNELPQVMIDKIAGFDDREAEVKRLGEGRNEKNERERTEGRLRRAKKLEAAWDVTSNVLDVAGTGIETVFGGALPGSGLVPTENPYWECMVRGLFAFFTGRTELKGSDLRSLAKDFLGMSNMGHVRPVMRLINRSFNVFLKKDVGSWWTALGSLFTGKTLDVLNIFAMIGDKILDRDAYKLKLEQVQARLGSQQTDAFLSDFSSLSLARERMGHSSTMARTLMLNVQGVTISSPARDASGSINPSGKETSINKTPPSNSGGLVVPPDKNQEKFSAKDRLTWGTLETRIPTEISSQFEESLQSEYIPFYFHDIRTNEIISFHAFLENLQDTFTSAVDPVEAMGRVEPIKIYKGTQRKVGFSFYIVALSSDDFSVMWEKINKLVTLVYPQYTRGRVLEHIGKAGDFNDPSFKFIQPFSQMMSASPMIRLRIGNVIRSNYTDEAMEDLFGVTEDDMFNPDVKFPPYQVPQPPSFEASLYYATDRAETEGKPGDRLSDNRTTLISLARFLVNYSPYIEKIQLIGRADERNSDKYNKDLAERRVKNAQATIEKYIFELLTGYLGNDDKTIDWLTNVGSKDLNFELINEGESKSAQGVKNNPQEIWKKDRVVIVKTVMKPRKISDAETNLIKQRDEAIKAATLSKGDLVQNFMNFGQNSIIRTFKDSGAGGGLAGFLESMAFEWISGNQTTWDVNDGRKAPKICKVTMDFSPIHDITPGLGWKGNNRAPVYNFSKYKALGKAPPLLTVPSTSAAVDALNKALEEASEKAMPIGNITDEEARKALDAAAAKDAAEAKAKADKIASARRAAARKAAQANEEERKRAEAEETYRQWDDLESKKEKQSLKAEQAAEQKRAEDEARKRDDDMFRVMESERKELEANKDAQQRILLREIKDELPGYSRSSRTTLRDDGRELTSFDFNKASSNTNLRIDRTTRRLMVGNVPVTNVPQKYIDKINEIENRDKPLYNSGTSGVSGLR